MKPAPRYEDVVEMPGVVMFLRRKKLYDVSGVVTEDGAYGDSFAKNEHWLRLAINPWRIAGKRTQNGTLNIWKLVSREELEASTRTIKPFDVLRMHVRVDRSILAPGSGDGLLLKVIGKVKSDREFLPAAIESQKTSKEKTKAVRSNVKSLSKNDKVLGRLVYNYSEFLGRLKWNGRRIKLRLVMEGAKAERSADRPESLVKMARALWKQQHSWDQKVQDYAAKKLMRTAWLEPGEKSLTTEQFKARIKLTSVSIYLDEVIRFHFASDLFTEHRITVTATRSKGPYRAEIE